MDFESIGCRDCGLYTQGRSCRMTEVAEQFARQPKLFKQVSARMLQDGILMEQMMVLGDAIELPPHDMENEDEQFWIYDGIVRGLDGIGRFVLGLEGNIEVMEGDELIEYLKRHAAHIADTY